MNFHSEPMEALTFKAYPEDSQRATPSLHHYMLPQWRFTNDRSVPDNTVSRHAKYQQNEISISCPLGKRHLFKPGEKEVHRSWLLVTTEGGLGAIRHHLINR